MFAVRFFIFFPSYLRRPEICRDEHTGQRGGGRMFPLESSSQPDSRRSETGTVWPVTAPSHPPLINKQANWINKQIALFPASWSTIKMCDKLSVNALTAEKKMKKIAASTFPLQFFSHFSPSPVHPSTWFGLSQPSLPLVFCPLAELQGDVAVRG